MAQDTTPAIVVYQGDGTNRVFSIPFDAGSGVINIEFVLRGATQTYEYSPLAFTVNDDNTALTWNGEPLQVGDFICISRSTTAHSLAMYEGDGVQTEFEIPFIRGFYGSIGVAFVYRGATQTYEYEPKTFSVDADNTLLTWTGATLNPGDYITIGRSTITGQPYELPNNQKHIEGALDNLSRQIQELKDRAVLVIDPTYRIGAPGKQNPIDWLKSIVRSKDFSVRGLRYDGKFLQFSLDNPDMPEHSKTWTSILNTVNVTTIREWYDKFTKTYHLQYSKDNGATWHALPISQTEIIGLEERLVGIENEQAVLNSGIQGNANAIAKTRDDMNAEDGRLQSQITAHAAAITTNRNDIDDLGDDVAEIQSKVPGSASSANPLVTKQDLLDTEMNIREDMNSEDSNLQSQITAHAAAITKLDSEKLDKQQGSVNAGKVLVVGDDGNIELTSGIGGGGLQAVAHDYTLSGAGTDASPLGLSETVKDELASKAPKETVEALTQIINGIIGDYVKKTGDTMTGALNVPEFTVSTAEGTLSISIVAGVPVIASNNGMDIASRVKFDYAPTTDDTTTWANANDTSLVRKAQVAGALENIGLIIRRL